MYVDIMLWLLENPTSSNVIIIAKIIDDRLATTIGCLSTVWSRGVLLSHAKREWLQRALFPVGSAPSFLTAIFDGGNISGSKGKLADTLADSED